MLPFKPMQQRTSLMNELDKQQLDGCTFVITDGYETIIGGWKDWRTCLEYFHAYVPGDKKKRIEVWKGHDLLGWWKEVDEKRSWDILGKLEVEKGVTFTDASEK